MKSVLGKIMFKKWLNNANSKELFPEMDGKLAELINNDDYYTADTIYTLMEEAFKAGMLLRENKLNV